MTRRTILVIDDDADDRTFFKEAMKEVSPEIETYTCESGIQAIALLSDETLLPPDYIFLDLNMPLMNGKECLLELGKILHRQLTKIIVLSTSALKEDMEDSIRLGAKLFLTKPNSFEGLCKILKDVIEEGWQKQFLKR
ncbi:response regulator [Chitinophaga sp. MM2321]|uniref:response regulator n=1 Tax=Chitinophaga sp. MM2321 TaxID=3137178 RepID=UPI0032D571F3